MLLLYPPIAKPCEPPGGIAQLAGTLGSHSITCRSVDLNIEGLHYLLQLSSGRTDTWSRRAEKNKTRHLKDIRTADLYASPARYQRCVRDLNRLLEQQGKAPHASLVNYQDPTLSPLKSEDLLTIAAHPEMTPLFPFFRSRLEELFLASEPRHIGISLTYLSQALNTFSLLGTIRKLLPNVHITVGGGLMTSWMQNGNWKEPFRGLIDNCVSGPGEQALLALYNQELSADVRPDFSDMAGNAYLAPGFILPYTTSSGCFWNKCRFCPERAENNRYIQKRAEKVFSDIDHLSAGNNPVLLHLLDNAIPPSILRRMAENSPGIPWYGFARISHQLLDADFCRALRNSGCIMLKLGVESGDQGVLDRMEKGLEIQMISKVLKNLRSSGISTYVYLLFGTPHESAAEAEKTLSFAKEHHREITFLNLAIFNMPTGSMETDITATSPFYGGDLTLYTDFIHPRGWSRKKVRRFLDRSFKKDQQLAEIIKRDPAFFTSNHAPFFCNFPFS